MRVLARFNILSKLLAVVALIGMIVGGCIWHATARMASIDNAYAEFLTHEAAAIANLSRINRRIFELSYYNYRSIADSDAAQLPRLKSGFDASATRLNEHLTALPGQAPAFASQAAALKERVNLFVSNSAEASELASVGLKSEALDLLHRNVDPTFEAMVADASRLNAELRAVVEKGERELTDETRATRHATMALGAAGLLAGVFAGVLVAVFGITRPMTSLVGVLQRMARGEVDAEIAEAARGDEIGAVGRAVQGIRDMVAQKAAERAEIERIADEAAAAERRRTTIDLADGFERAVGSIVGQVSASATELQATAQTMTATATQTAGQSTAVASAAEEAASNVNTVAAAAEELGASVQEIGRQVDSSASLARQAVSEADQTGAAVQELSAAVARIGDVVGLISSIAGQTNLLALNATIEAARAGAAGRGFAVVAAEVKALAGQTAKATQEISGQIARIQASTGNAVSAIAAIAARIQEISGVATSIAAAVEQQGAATQEIVRNVSQAAMGAGAVTSNIAGVAGAAEETGVAASQVLGAASELSRQSEHLAAEVGHFLATVRAA